MINAIIEYLPIDHAESGGGANWELFSVALSNGTSNEYLKAVKMQMQQKSGIYIFYDSVGRAIYVGKAKRQTLWKEANLAFNRDRKQHQSIWTVKHPTNNVKKVKLDRKISNLEVQLSEIATYFSAYEVAEGQINNMEAFLIRAFANNLMNKNIPTLSNEEEP